jgi:hypothetical protein
VSITVTATAAGTPHDGIAIQVFVVDGGVLAGTPVTASQSGVAAHQESVTPSQDYSLIWGGVFDGDAAAIPWDAGSTQITGQQDTTNGGAYGVFSHSTGAAGAGTPVTIGSAASYQGGLAALEVLPAVTGTAPTADASSPAFAWAAGAATITTAAFTPAGGATLLVAVVLGYGYTGYDTTSMAVSDTGGHTWTQQAAGNATGQGYAGVWTAPLTSSVAGTATLTGDGQLSAASGGAERGAASLAGAGSLTAGGSVSGTGQKLFAVPYSYPPSGFWTDVIDNAPNPVALVLANVDSGPGTGYEANFGTVYTAAAAAGATVVGYISTNGATVSAGDVETQVAAWFSYYGAYGLAGIFLDVCACTAANETYYTGIVNYVHSNYPGSIVVLNPGDIPDQDYLSLPIGDVIQVCEDNYTDFLTDAANAPSWLFNHSPSQISVVVNNCPTEADMVTAVGLSQTAFNAGYVWVTNGTGGNPYEDEPSYFAAEVALVKSGPAAATQGTAVLAGTATLTAAAQGSSQVVNQWSNGVFQPTAFTSMPAGCGSCVVPLNPSASVGAGSGTPTEGNWLFALIGWNLAAQDSVPGNPPSAVVPQITVWVGDDTHMWWRAAPVTPESPGQVIPDGPLCWTHIWYQPNIIPPQRVYVAPTGFCTGLSVLVVEVAGLGDWDAVTAYVSNGAFPLAAGTSLPLAVPEPAAESFVIAAATGTLASAGTAAGGTGWTPLQTVTTVNGTDDSSDTVLAACWTGADAAVTAEITGTGTAMCQGLALAVQTGAPTPVPEGMNPYWPYLLTEVAWGAGYQTPEDQRTWTALLQDVAAGSGSGYGDVYPAIYGGGGLSAASRLRSWDENTGVQYELDQLEASELELLIDNPDGYLSPFNAESPWFPDVIPGTPIRLRMVPPPGVGVNRWYVIERNMERWPQSWSQALRGQVNGTATDAWSVINKTLPTCYRAEILNDLPYAWWPCDDSGGNNATSLVNAAPGNDNPLVISTINGPAVAVAGYPFTADVIYSAVTAWAQDTGWMYGDPDSAAFSVSGTGSGAYGYYLACYDPNFPQLTAPGCTIEAWFNLDLLDASGTAALQQGLYGQPGTNLIIWQLGTSVDDAPAVAQLYVNSAGDLIFSTWYGATGTSTTLVSQVCRTGGWMGVTIAMVTDSAGGGTWVATINGGQGGIITGNPEQWTPTWQYFYALGSGSGASNTQAGCCNGAVAHLEVFPAFLPAARVMAHHMAAYTGFGQLPQPVISTEFISNTTATYDPSGVEQTGRAFNSPGDGDATLSAAAVAVCGDAYSGPSYPVEQLTVLPTDTPPGFCFASAGSGDSTQGSFATPAYAWYTASGSGSLKKAASGLAPYLYINGYGAGDAPPAAASGLGDTVQARIERLLQAGQAAGPRCIDPAQTACLAMLDSGGQPCGDDVSNIVQSDGGLAFVDAMNAVCYWDRAHLAPASGSAPVALMAPVWSVPPGGQWTTVTGAAPTVQYLVANVASGPGTVTIAAYATAIEAAQAAGIMVLGYIPTGQGTVPTATVEAQILAWQNLYGVTSVYFDQVSPAADQISYYETLSTYARTEGATAVVLNCGGPPDEGYMALADVVVVFAGSVAAWDDGWEAPSWLQDYPASQIAAIVWACGTSTAMTSAIAGMQTAGIGVAYVTNQPTYAAGYTSVPGLAIPGLFTPGAVANETTGRGEPYSAIPSYWAAEVAAAQATTAAGNLGTTWVLGPDTSAGQIPYKLPTSDAWDTDPQQVKNDIELTQYDVTQAGAEAQAGLSTGSAETSGGLVFSPAAAYYQAILASLEQYGDCQYQITSYLQSTSEIQSQANWLFETYGVARQRIVGLTVDAAPMTRTCPQAWLFVLSVNPGDIVTATQSMPGQPSFSGSWRITHIERKIDFGAGTAAVTIEADYLPPSMWS